MLSNILFDARHNKANAEMVTAFLERELCFLELIDFTQAIVEHDTPRALALLNDYTDILEHDAQAIVDILEVNYEN